MTDARGRTACFVVSALNLREESRDCHQINITNDDDDDDDNSGAPKFACVLLAFTKVSARRLVWDSLDRNGDRAALLESAPDGGGRFDLIVASDCLFFKARPAMGDCLGDICDREE